MNTTAQKEMGTRQCPFPNPPETTSTHDGNYMSVAQKTGDPSWADIDAELSKGEQMGHQTVMQFARVGQMLAAKMGTMSLREFVPRVGQYIPRLTKSTIHRYLTLAQHLPLLEKAQPDSQNEALRLIAATKAPAQPVPSPVPAQAPQAPSQGAPAPEGADDGNRTEKMVARVDALPDKFALSGPMRERYAKAVEAAISELKFEFSYQVAVEVNKQVKERFKTEHDTLTAEIKEAHEEKERWSILNQGVTAFLSEDEFRLIRNCLHSDRVPEEMKGKFDRAFAAFNKLDKYFAELRLFWKKRAERSERAKAAHAAKKAVRCETEGSAA